MRTRCTFSLLAVLILAVAAPAQTPAPAQAAAPAKATAPEPVKASTATRDHDTLSVDFPDEDIRTILRNVADLFELNLVIPDTLTGKTTIKLRDVTWRQIFKVVLEPANYTYVEDGNIIKIVSKELLEQEATVTEVLVLNNAKAADIKPTIDGLVDPAKGGRVLVEVRSNALIVTERPSRITHVKATVEQLDKATDQVMIESKFVEVTNGDVDNLGIKWSSLSGYTVNAQPTDLVLRGGSHLPTVVDPSSGTASLTGQVSDASTTFATVLSADAFSMVLSALKTQSNTKIVSNPTVVTLNNVEATINVGEEDPIPKYAYNQTTGTYEVTGFDMMKIGVILKVTPQVNARGIIKLNLAPEVSQKSGSTTFGTATIPIKATRSVTTQVSLKDGNTVGIGGLLSSSRSHSGTKIPVLGSIPGLGKLFSSKSVDDSVTNLLIFITARTVKAEGLSAESIFKKEALDSVEELSQTGTAKQPAKAAGS